MNEQLQEALVKLIQQSTAVAGDALAFTQQQLPEVIQQLLVWKAWVSAFWIVVSLGLVYSVWVHIRFALKTKGTRNGFYFDRDDPQPSWVFVGCHVILVGLPGLVSLMEHILKLIQIFVAPKIYLLEYAAKLISYQ